MFKITGLAVSLVVSILLLLWVNDELSDDRFNVNAANIYKLSRKFDEQNISGSTSAYVSWYQGVLPL